MIPILGLHTEYLYPLPTNSTPTKLIQSIENTNHDETPELESTEHIAKLELRVYTRRNKNQDG